MNCEIRKILHLTTKQTFENNFLSIFMYATKHCNMKIFYKKYFTSKNILSQNKQRIKYTIAILHVLSKNLAHGTIAQSLYFVQNITGQTAFTSGPPVHISDTFRKRRLYRFCLFIRYLFYLSKKKKIFILIIFLAIIEDKNTCTIHARIYHVKCPFGVPHEDFQVHASLHGAPHQASSLL